jgi:hypothetical protein
MTVKVTVKRVSALSRVEVWNTRNGLSARAVSRDSGRFVDNVSARQLLTLKSGS